MQKVKKKAKKPGKREINTKENEWTRSILGEQW